MGVTPLPRIEDCKIKPLLHVGCIPRTNMYHPCSGPRSYQTDLAVNYQSSRPIKTRPAAPFSSIFVPYFSELHLIFINHKSASQAWYTSLYHVGLHRPRYLLPGPRQRDQHESQSLDQQPKGWNANQSIVKPIPNLTQSQLMVSNLLGLQ